jgi:hypothetical protein
LKLAIRESRADRYAKKQFKHAASSGAYIEKKDLARFTYWIERWGDEAVEVVE